MARVRLEGVQKRYGETRVLERVDLDVADGEYIVLLGKSGCGKSTLLRCIAGLETITPGHLLHGHRRLNRHAHDAFGFGQSRPFRGPRPGDGD